MSGTVWNEKTNKTFVKRTRWTVTQFMIWLGWRLFESCLTRSDNQPYTEYLNTTRILSSLLQLRITIVSEVEVTQGEGIGQANAADVGDESTASTLRDRAERKKKWGMIDEVSWVWEASVLLYLPYVMLSVEWAGNGRTVEQGQRAKLTRYLWRK